MKDFYFSFIRILIVQLICIALITVTLLTVKLVWKKEYKAAAEFYETRILSETTTDEVLREETTNGI